MSVPILDSSTNGAGTTSTVTSLSWTHTCSGLNRYLFVPIYFNSPVTSLVVTYNGVAMTQVDNVNDASKYGYFYGLVNPDAGSSYTVSATWTTARYACSNSISYNNVNQSTPLGTGAKISMTGSPTSLNISLGSEDIGIGFFVAQNQTSTVFPTITAVGTGQTDRCIQTWTAGASSARIRAGDITGTGTVTMSWTSSNATPRFSIAYPLRGAAISSGNFFQFFN